MAIYACSTPAPTRPLLPLAAPDRRAIGRDGWARAREAASRLGGEIRAHLAEGMCQAWAAARAMIAQPTPLLRAPAPLPSLTTAFARRRAIFGAVAVDEPDTAAQARAIHARREMHATLEWGFAFLDAFDLGPLALDVIDGAIARMDARDAPDEDREPYLTGTPSPLGLDVEDDSEEFEGTALERHGRGFTASGPDDTEEDDPAEDGADAEQTYEDGSEDTPHPWRFERPDAVQRAAMLCEVSHA